MRRCVVDFEVNGLLYEVIVIYCGCFIDVDI